MQEARTTSGPLPGLSKPSSDGPGRDSRRCRVPRSCAGCQGSAQADCRFRTDGARQRSRAGVAAPSRLHSSGPWAVDDCLRGIAVTPSRDAARSHLRGRSRGDGGCWTGALARYRLAPRRREMTFGRPRTRPVGTAQMVKAIVAVVAAARSRCPKPSETRSSRRLRPSSDLSTRRENSRGCLKRRAGAGVGDQD